jgi:hypothetical protein
LALFHYPHYTVPKPVFADLVLAVLTGQQRRFKAHADRMVNGIFPPLRVLGEEYIPRGGPGVITVNHYNRPGFWSPWFPTSISASVPADIYWTMTSAWTYPGRRFGWLYRWLSSQMLTRIACVYGFNSMPPMPPAPDEITQRAESVSRLVRYVRANPHALIGLAPEGGDQPGGVLGLPPSGFGRLALVLASTMMPFYPVGAYEEDGCFILHFGAPYRLQDKARAGVRNHADGWAVTHIMGQIAACLPEQLQGIFHSPKGQANE